MFTVQLSLLTSFASLYNSDMSKKVDSKFNRQFFRQLFKIIVGILTLAILIVASIFVFGLAQKKQLQKAQSTLIPSTIKKILSNPETKIESIDNLRDVSGVYQFILKLETNGKKSTRVIYMTKDGSVVFTSGIKMEDIKNMSASPSAAQNQ